MTKYKYNRNQLSQVFATGYSISKAEILDKMILATKPVKEKYKFPIKECKHENISKTDDSKWYCLDCGLFLSSPVGSNPIPFKEIKPIEKLDTSSHDLMMWPIMDKINELISHITALEAKKEWRGFDERRINIIVGTIMFVIFIFFLLLIISFFIWK